MALTHTYADAYLAPLITEEREARAMAEVAELGTLPQAWATRLAVLRAYVLTCIECGQAPDDLFAAKLAAYRIEHRDALAQARAAQAVANAGDDAATSAGGSVWSVPLERA